MEEHGQTKPIDPAELVDGKYKYDQVYLVPIEQMKRLEDTSLEAADYLRFTIKAGFTPEQGKSELAEVVRKVLNLGIDEFLEGFDDTAT